MIRREGSCGRITLNRPKALNALTLGMVRQIRPALTAWASDPAVTHVLLDGAGERALCAGGDVLWLYESRKDGSGAARTFWREEYALNSAIARFPKPYVAIMDGIVMGGGIGLSAHARHRIVTERSQLAMPETSIGLVPDVGGTWLLAHAPGLRPADSMRGEAPAELGVYLGMVGERMQGAGAIFAGFADTFVPGERRAALTEALCACEGRQVTATIARFATPPPSSNLADLAPAIARTFTAKTVEAIVAALENEGGPWAERTLTELRTRSPLALKATLAAVRQARALPSLEAALATEFRLCTHFFERGEFPEGVRALLVDKDKSPKWRPATLGQVTDADVAAVLGPLPDGEELRLG